MDLDLAWLPTFTTDSLNRSGPTAASILTPTNLNAAASAVAASFAAMTGPGILQWQAPLAFQAWADNEDRVARARALAALLSPATDAGSMMLGRALAADGHFPPPLPLAIVRNQLIDKVKTDATLGAARRDMAEFEKEAAKLADKPDKKEVTEYIAKFIKDRGLKTGESKEFRDQYTIGQDDGLKPLVEKQSRGHAGFELPNEFGRSFFFDVDRLAQREVPSTTLYAPQQFPPQRFPGDGDLLLREGEPSYLAWRTADQPSESPKDFEKTKPKIVELWKRIEARKLAAAAAEELAKENREVLAKEPEASREMSTVIFRVFSDLHGKYQSQFPTLADKFRSEFFQIDNVSPISMPRNMFTPQSMRPTQFQLTPRKEMPYPTYKMQNDLLENKDKPLGTTLVMSDESRDRYYVAVLDDRQFRSYLFGGTEQQFYDQVYSGVGVLSNEIRQRLHQAESGAAYRNAVALLKAEFKVEGETEKLTESKKR
jgi:hypothetical protein